MNTGRTALPILGSLDDNVDATVVSFISLGCAKNLVDSEVMLGKLAEAGCVISADESVADIVVVNTCGFLASGRDEVLEICAELAQRKRDGSLKRIVVAGCLVQRDGETLRERVPEIDVLVGVNNRDDIVRAVAPDYERTKAATVDRYLGDYQPQPWSDRTRLRLTPRHYAYIRISEGCNQKCTFCTIPSIRGPMHCKSPDELVAECRTLIADGARELILIGQDTTSYGQDIGYQPGLSGLLRRLDAECEGADWIRLMYVYPSIMTDDMIDAIAECERVVKYIDIPLQHINDRVLKAMHRRVTRRQTEALLERIRGRIPDVTMRTTFIVGFPGESEAEFQELVDFAGDFGFDAAGTFNYSSEPETPAGRMSALIDPDVIEARHERLMLAQQEVAFAAARRRVGRVFDVLVDDSNRDEYWSKGRHAGQAPEVDSVCLIDGEQLETGQFVQVKCVEADEYDLVVRPTSVRLSTLPAID